MADLDGEQLSQQDNQKLHKKSMDFVSNGNIETNNLA